MPKNSKFNENDPFYHLEGRDGFHAVTTRFGNVASLSILAYGGGELFNVLGGDAANTSVELLKLSDPTEAELGSCERLRLVMDAVCRYLTTGGSWQELRYAMNETEKIAQGGIVFPGYSLIDSYSTTDGNYQHVFREGESDNVVLWTESVLSESGLPLGGRIEKTTIDALYGEDDDGTATENTIRIGKDSIRAQLQIPHRSGDGDAADTERCYSD